MEPSAKRSKSAEDEENGVTRSSLVKTITSMATGLSEIVEEASESLKKFGAEKFVSDKMSIFGKAIGQYSQYLAAHCVNTREEAEKVVAPFCRHEDVRQAVDELFAAEDHVDSLLSSVDKQLSAISSNNLSAGETFPLSLMLSRLPSSRDSSAVLSDLRTVSVGDLIGEWQGSTLFVLLRHLSWLPWRDHISELLRCQKELAAQSCRVVVVSFSDVAHVQKWRRDTGFPFDVLADPERGLYKALDLPRRVAPVWCTKVLLYYGEQKLAGRYLPPTVDGDDLLQMGGDFLLDSAGKVMLIHRSLKSSKDRPSVQQILECLRSNSKSS